MLTNLTMITLPIVIWELRFLHLPSFFPIRLMLSDVPTAV